MSTDRLNLLGGRTLTRAEAQAAVMKALLRDAPKLASAPGMQPVVQQLPDLLNHRRGRR